MKEVKTTDAVGMVLCHDITQIIPGEVKGVRFKKGHVIKTEDVDALLDLGKANIYVWEKQDGMLHEDEAAHKLAKLLLNDNMTTKDPREGKIDVVSQIDGVLLVDTDRLKKINMSDQMMVATRFNYDPIKTGETIAGTRVIPLVIEEEKLNVIADEIGTKPILEVAPYLPLKAGIITTGSEVFNKRIEDKFTPVIAKKLEKYGIEVKAHKIVDDNKEDITNSILEMKKNGIDFILCSGGMSVDPDDRTPGAIKDTGVNIVTYGAPMLPGSMFLLGYFENDMPIVGLPGCVMYNDTTIFDVMLPRLAAGIKISKEDIAVLGHGGLCLKCDICHWPICQYGKGR